MVVSTRAAIVTGASTGIGHAVAKTFAERGWHVHNLARRPSGVAGVVDHRVDLSDVSQVEAAGACLREQLVDAASVCVVHNAAVMHQDSVDAFDVQSFEWAMRLNVTAPALLNASLRPSLRPGSSIVFIGSTLSDKAVPGRASYVTSKHAVVGLMRATCQDLFGSGVHTACICPGFTDTEMLRPVLEAHPQIKKAVLEMVSFGRLIDPAEIADLVHYVACNPVLNGAVLHANLGQRES